MNRVWKCLAVVLLASLGGASASAADWYGPTAGWNRQLPARYRSSYAQPRPAQVHDEHCDHDHSHGTYAHAGHNHAAPSQRAMSGNVTRYRSQPPQNYLPRDRYDYGMQRQMPAPYYGDRFAE